MGGNFRNFNKEKLILHDENHASHDLHFLIITIPYTYILPHVAYEIKPSRLKDPGSVVTLFSSSAKIY